MENTELKADIEGLTVHLCQMIVKHPDDIKVQKSGGQRSIIITATVAEDDVGRVIGKKGGTIKAIRYLLDQAGRKQNSRIFFELANKTANRMYKAARTGEAAEDGTPIETPETQAANENDDDLNTMSASDDSEFAKPDSTLN